VSAAPHNRGRRYPYAAAAVHDHGDSCQAARGHPWWRGLGQPLYLKRAKPPINSGALVTDRSSAQVDAAHLDAHLGLSGQNSGVILCRKKHRDFKHGKIFDFEHRRTRGCHLARLLEPLRHPPRNGSDYKRVGQVFLGDGQ